MEIKTGIDLVYLPRFGRALKSGGSKFLQRIYLPDELHDKRIAHLAGIFAAKEAVIKALNLPTDSWHDIQITYTPGGAPLVKLTNHYSLITNHSLSISHDGNYAIAQFIVILKSDVVHS